MDIKKIVIIAVVLLLVIIGYNQYSSAKSKESRAEKQAEIKTLRANAPESEVQQPIEVANLDVDQLQDNVAESTSVASDDELFGAANKKVESERKANDSICEKLIPLAENIMRSRLNDIPISTSLEAANSIKDGNPANEAVSNLAKQMVIDAYERPPFSTESYKDDAIREFGAKQYLSCMRAFN